MTVPGFMKTPLKVKLVDWWDPKKPKPIETGNPCKDPGVFTFF